MHHVLHHLTPVALPLNDVRFVILVIDSKVTGRQILTSVLMKVKEF
jgi:hypothetical protein